MKLLWLAMLRGIAALLWLAGWALSKITNHDGDARSRQTSNPQVAERQQGCLASQKRVSQAKSSRLDNLHPTMALDGCQDDVASTLAPPDKSCCVSSTACGLLVLWRSAPLRAPT